MENLTAENIDQFNKFENTKEKKNKYLKYFVFLAACTGQFTNLYISQIPQGIETELINSSEFHLSYSQYNYLFSFYNLPNILVCPLSGVLIAKYGSAKVFFFLSIFMLSGGILSTIAVYKFSYITLLFGRIICGSSAGSLNIALVKNLNIYFFLIYSFFYANEK